MNEYYNQLASQFAQSNMQEQRWLREEIDELENTLKALIVSNDGKLSFYERDLHIAKTVKLVVEEDKANRRINLTVQ